MQVMQGNVTVLVSVLFASILISSSDLSASQNTYGGVAYDAVYDAIQTDDGGYIAIGNSASFDPSLVYYDVYLIKTDAAGTLQWQKTIGSPFWESGYGFNKTSDGGYIIVGSKTNQADNTTDVYVVKVDGSGDVQWEKTFGGPKNDKARAVEQTLDGGYIVFGDSASFGSVPFQQDMYVIKLGGDGSKEWETVIGGDFTEWTWGGMQTSDGGYVVIGDTRSFSTPVGFADAYLVKLDEDGNQVWDKTYGDVNIDMGRSVLQTPDGGFLIAGETFPAGASANKAYLVKTDLDGNMQWSRTYGPASQDTVARSVKATPDGGFIIAGEQNAPTGFDKNGYLLKVDALGDLQWDATYGGASIEFIYSVSVTSDDGYILAGRTLSYGAGNYDAFLIKLNSEGEHDVWADLGGGTAGVGGQPVFQGSGDLSVGSTLGLDLTNAPSNAIFLMWMSVASTPVDVVGGTLYPLPAVAKLILSADPLGDFSVSAVVDTAVPPGVDIWFQCIVQDASTIHGITLSNALKATIP
jgi:hypothetical protein